MGYMPGVVFKPGIYSFQVRGYTSDAEDIVTDHSDNSEGKFDHGLRGGTGRLAAGGTFGPPDRVCAKLRAGAGLRGKAGLLLAK
jgi:hypothetical protein